MGIFRGNVGIIFLSNLSGILVIVSFQLGIPEYQD